MVRVLSPIPGHAGHSRDATQVSIKKTAAERNYTHMKRTIIITIAGFLLLTSLTLVGVAQATPPSNLTSTTLGRISLGPFHKSSHGFKISSRHSTDTVVLTTTINPGGSTGWHSHPGPAFIVVIRGTLTVYDGNDPRCTPHRYRPGNGFLDPGFGHVHIARNAGSTPVTVVQTYLNVPPGGSPRIDAPAPGNCPFSRTSPAETGQCRPPPRPGTHGPSRTGGQAE